MNSPNDIAPQQFTAITFDQFASTECLEFSQYKHIYVDMCDGDLVAGILLSRIVYWFGKSKNTGKSRILHNHNGRPCLIKSRADWWDECRINEKSYDKAVAILKEKKIIFSEVHFSPFHCGKRCTFIFLNKDVFSEILNKLLFEQNKPEENIDPDQDDQHADSGISKFPNQDFEITASEFRNVDPVISSYKTKTISKDYRQRRARSAVSISDSPSFQKFGSHVNLRSQDYHTLCESLGESKVKELIDSVNDYCASCRPGGYSCYAAAIRNFAKRQKGDQPYKPKASKPSLNDVIMKGSSESFMKRSEAGGVNVTREEYEKIAAQADRDGQPDDKLGYIVHEPNGDKTLI